MSKAKKGPATSTQTTNVNTAAASKQGNKQQWNKQQGHGDKSSTGTCGSC